MNKKFLELKIFVASQELKLIKLSINLGSKEVAIEAINRIIKTMSELKKQLNEK